MRQDNINGQDIEVCIIATDGSELAEDLQPGEREWLAKIDAALRADAGFAKACPKATLERIDSNRGLADRGEGRFYLRYSHQGKGGMAEFWGNTADVASVDIQKGIVSVAG